MPVARSMLLFLGVAAFFAGVVAPVCAVAAEDTADSASDTSATTTEAVPFRLPTLEVRGARIDRQGRVDRDAGFATVLEESEWYASTSGTAELLGRAVGVNVRDSGGLGGYSTVSLRGSTPAQVPIYLDGVLLNGADSGTVDLSTVHLADLDRVEVYRGSAPLVLGGGSMGGAIHLYSAGGRQPLRLFARRGSFDSYALEAAGSVRLHDWTLAARARGVRSSGDWEYLDDHGTLYNSTDDRRRTRDNNDARGGGILLSASRATLGGTLRVSEMVDAREQGIPGYSTLTSTTARSRAFTHQARVGWEALPASEAWLRSVEAHHRSEVQGVEDPEASLGRVARDRNDRVHVVGISASGGLRRLGSRFWRAEVDASFLRSRDEALAQPEGAEQSRWTVAGALQPQWRAMDGRLLLSPGVRWALHHQRFDAGEGSNGLATEQSSSPDLRSRTIQFGARYELARDLSVKANLGVFERLPTLLELFGDRGTAQGNAALRPESGTNRDVGLVWAQPREGRRFAVSVYVNDAFDLITFVKTSPVTAKAMNVGRAEIRGLEVEADFGHFGPWSARAALTRMQTKDLTDSRVANGKQLPGRPGYEVELATGLHLGAVDLGFSLFALGDNYAQTGERAPVPSRVLLGIDARWALRDGLALIGRVDNLGDVEVFDLWGYPLPGRQVSIAISTGAW